LGVDFGNVFLGIGIRILGFGIWVLLFWSWGKECGGREGDTGEGGTEEGGEERGGGGQVVRGGGVIHTQHTNIANTDFLVFVVMFKIC
jgi:hypothetical protein